MRRISHLALHCCAALALFSAIANSACAESIVATTADGGTVQGELAQWDSSRVEISVDGKPKAFAPADLLEIRSAAAPADQQEFSPYLELVDGSRLPITEFTVADRVAEVVSPLAAKSLRIRAEQIRLVRFVDVGDSSLLTADATGDTIAVLNTDSTDTEVLTGVIDNVSSEQVQFTWESDTFPVRRSKIAALGFYHKNANRRQTPPLCMISLASGAELAARQIRMSGAALKVQTVSGVDVQVPLTDLIAADYSLGKLAYISDMQPLKSHMDAAGGNAGHRRVD